MQKKKKYFEKKKLKENQRQSLLGISNLVLEYIKKTKKQTGNQVTEFVQKTLQLKNNDKLTQKNIQRRVYDSINVMIGFGRIKKKERRRRKTKKSKRKKNTNRKN